MKKKTIGILITLILAFVLGSAFFYKSTHLEETHVYGLQVGAYKNKENALKKKQEVNGMILELDGYYKVYGAILTKEESLNKVEAYFKENNISFIRKELEISPIQEATYYEELLQVSDISYCLNKINNYYEENYGSRDY